MDKILLGSLLGVVAGGILILGTVFGGLIGLGVAAWGA